MFPCEYCEIKLFYRTPLVAASVPSVSIWNYFLNYLLSTCTICFTTWIRLVSVDTSVLANICSSSTTEQHVKEQRLAVHMFNVNHVSPSPSVFPFWVWGGKKFGIERRVATQKQKQMFLIWNFWIGCLLSFTNTVSFLSFVYLPFDLWVRIFNWFSC